MASRSRDHVGAAGGVAASRATKATAEIRPQHCGPGGDDPVTVQVYIVNLNPAPRRAPPRAIRAAAVQLDIINLNPPFAAPVAAVCARQELAGGGEGTAANGEYENGFTVEGDGNGYHEIVRAVEA